MKIDEIMRELDKAVETSYAGSPSYVEISLNLRDEIRRKLKELKKRRYASLLKEDEYREKNGKNT